MSRKADGCGGGKDNSGSLDGGSLTESSFRPLLIGSTSEPHRSLGRCLAILWQRLRSTPSQGRAWLACELYLFRHTGILRSATADKAFSTPQRWDPRSQTQSPHRHSLGVSVKAACFLGIYFWIGKSNVTVVSQEEKNTPGGKNRGAHNVSAKDFLCLELPWGRKQK